MSESTRRLRGVCRGYAEDARRLAGGLRDAGYVQEELVSRIGGVNSLDFYRRDTMMVRAGGDEPLPVAIRLLYLGETVPAGTVRRAFPEALLSGLLQHGLVAPAGSDGYRAALQIVPFHDLYVAGDYPPGRARPMRPNHVLGVGGASLTLAGLTVRGESSSTWDLGTGGGIQSLLASAHSARVVGSDTNPRALRLGAFNAWLNGISNIEWRRGSLFDPVDGERFDLIVSNPPFVISPENRFIYRDGGLEGDGISELVLRKTAEHLNPGGWACIMLNWYHDGPDDVFDRPLSWVSEVPADCWLLRFADSDPCTYASGWLRGEGYGRARFLAGLRDWLAYYDRLGARRFSGGLMVMRRLPAGGSGWRAACTVDEGSRGGNASEQIRRIFASRDFLHALEEPAAVLDRHIRLHPEHVLRQELHAGDGGWQMAGCRLESTSGVPFSGNTDMYVASLLAKCDGSRPLRDLVLELGARLEIDSAELSASVVAVVVSLMQLGFLEVVDDGGAVASGPRTAT